MYLRFRRIRVCREVQVIKTKSLDRRTICARAHVRPRGAVNFKLSRAAGMRACAETSNAYRLCLFTMDHGATVTNPEYCDNVSFSSEKSSEEDEEEEKEDKEGEKKYIVGGA